MTYRIKNKLEKHLQTNAIVLQHCKQNRDTNRKSASCECAMGWSEMHRRVQRTCKRRTREMEGTEERASGRWQNKGVLLGWWRWFSLLSLSRGSWAHDFISPFPDNSKRITESFRILTKFIYIYIFFLSSLFHSGTDFFLLLKMQYTEIIFPDREI